MSINSVISIFSHCTTGTKYLRVYGHKYTSIDVERFILLFVQENFELVDLLVSAPLEARKMSLQQYVTKMAIGDT